MRSQVSEKFMINEGVADFFDTTEVETPRTALETVRKKLWENGIDTGCCSPWTVDGAILLTEACNWAAKVLDSSFYFWKPRCIEECMELGAEGGWKNGIFYLYHPEVGVASFHDPMGEIQIKELYWPFEWSGVSRQEEAFELLTDHKKRKIYKYLTAPGQLGEWVRSWFGSYKPQKGQLP